MTLEIGAGYSATAEHLDRQDRDAGDVNHTQPENEHAFDREVSRVGALAAASRC